MGSVLRWPNVVTTQWTHCPVMQDLLFLSVPASPAPLLSTSGDLNLWLVWSLLQPHSVCVAGKQLHSPSSSESPWQDQALIPRWGWRGTARQLEQWGHQCQDGNIHDSETIHKTQHHLRGSKKPQTSGSHSGDQMAKKRHLQEEREVRNEQTQWPFPRVSYSNFFN